MWGGSDSRSADLGARFGRGWSELRNPVPEEKQAGVRVHLRTKGVHHDTNQDDIDRGHGSGRSDRHEQRCRRTPYLS